MYDNAFYEYGIPILLGVIILIPVIGIGWVLGGTGDLKYLERQQREDAKKRRKKKRQQAAA